ncbi:GNAT family N-acetyltransferase [Pseudonocardia sp. TRM90224]|uniref:GNAT family N-acetyltransferase n=1 Tax=Pseudonocardia sp. TRM90224 TaxID=2812678 RepID=UPI001E5B5542|nr:GNAT family N-acetyltransferase [Pseudonocardia sp. TRM90224]
MDVLQRIDLFCDAVPRTWATVTDDGPLRLFSRNGPGWPLYARPIPGGGPVTAADVARMRARQRALRVPEAFEWVPAAAPSMTDVASRAGLSVQVCPLLVLEGEPAAAELPVGCTARLLGPADGDLQSAASAALAVTANAFGAAPPGGMNERALAALRADLAAGTIARLLVTGPDGPVAAGSAQRSGDVVELTGIATDARHRGKGIAAAVTAVLASAARAAGAALVFLAAGDDGASRVYRRTGFTKVGECAIAQS